jgi:predicted glycosyltransferase involved in capsule biosynthesis
VCSCFPAKLFDELGGLFEGYVGWGCEDQDLIERMCLSELTLVRSYDLLYFHLPHGHETGWREAALIAQNRKLFAERRRILFPPFTLQD